MATEYLVSIVNLSRKCRNNSMVLALRKGFAKGSKAEGFQAIYQAFRLLQYILGERIATEFSQYATQRQDVQS
jgi:hypothetical protein